MNKPMVDNYAIRSDWATNQELLRYKLLVQKVLQKAVTNKFIIEQFIKFTDLHIDEFTAFLGNLAKEDTEVASEVNE